MRLLARSLLCAPSYGADAVVMVVLQAWKAYRDELIHASEVAERVPDLLLVSLGAHIILCVDGLSWALIHGSATVAGMLNACRLRCALAR